MKKTNNVPVMDIKNHNLVTIAKVGNTLYLYKDTVTDKLYIMKDFGGGHMSPSAGLILAETPMCKPLSDAEIEAKCNKLREKSIFTDWRNSMTVFTPDCKTLVYVIRVNGELSTFEELMLKKHHRGESLDPEGIKELPPFLFKKSVDLTNKEFATRRMMYGYCTPFNDEHPFPASLIELQKYLDAHNILYYAHTDLDDNIDGVSIELYKDEDGDNATILNHKKEILKMFTAAGYPKDQATWTSEQGEYEYELITNPSESEEEEEEEDFDDEFDDFDEDDIDVDTEESKVAISFLKTFASAEKAYKSMPVAGQFPTVEFGFPGTRKYLITSWAVRGDCDINTSVLSDSLAKKIDNCTKFHGYFEIGDAGSSARANLLELTSDELYELLDNCCRETLGCEGLYVYTRNEYLTGIIIDEENTYDDLIDVEYYLGNNLKVCIDFFNFSRDELMSRFNADLKKLQNGDFYCTICEELANILNIDCVLPVVYITEYRGISVVKEGVNYNAVIPSNGTDIKLPLVESNSSDYHISAFYPYSGEKVYLKFKNC